ncbi:FecR family protein [Desulfobotulus sp. H1]|uniref:FecR family protein n=1 Tax=Desulfobotulus pelophilus TaxID=2823377 RepID=A0ABT3N9I0_9BACT|nr:FecR family protein [Desulfobotulus pelophilus]MCW7754116.1 FecR family protein [Desulfobotulus pelophilus]
MSFPTFHIRTIPLFIGCVFSSFCLLYAASALADTAETAPKPKSHAGIVLTHTEGSVRILDPSSPFPKAPGELPRILQTGDRVQTQRNARALIFSPDGELILDSDSMLHVLESEGTQLESGTALYEITARDGKRVTARTPLVVIGVKGTRFMVSVGEHREDVALFKGRVGIEREDQQPMAFYQAKSPRDMTFSEYVTFQRQSFGDYRKALMQDFSDYKATMAAEFRDFKKEIDLTPGKRLTMGSGETPEAVEADVDRITQENAQSLHLWKQKASQTRTRPDMPSIQN